MIREHDLVVLTHDFVAQDLRQGDIGVVVHCYGDGQAYEVEFMSAEGKTIAILTLEHHEVRAMGSGEILHVRELSAT